MRNYALEINNISKQYRLGNVGSKTFGQDIQRLLARIKGKEDPFLKLGDVNDKSIKGESDFVWALRDIDFKVSQGEVLGIIGKNGAGKSTLLKLLSRVTAPTTGTITAKGRMASLLEVGTGFHPELTGRENIFLNGAILGMTKREIRYKLDEIINFSGVERYIDTPVKRYSSGMYVRLAFAVAAHLDPEILIVDEVLAVGDADFQKKAIGKMKEVSQGEGRTVLFVSHNMTSVKNLCTSGIVLENGQLTFLGSSEDAVDHYLRDMQDDCWSYSFDREELENDFVFTNEITLESTSGQKIVNVSDELAIKIRYTQKLKGKVSFCVVVFTENEEVAFTTMNNQTKIYLSDKTPGAGEYLTTLKIPANTLNNKRYYIKLIINGPGYGYEDHKYKDKVIRFELDDCSMLKGDFLRNFDGIVRPICDWETVQLD